MRKPNADWRTGEHFWRYLRAIGACRRGYGWVRKSGYSFDEAWQAASAEDRAWMLVALDVVGALTPPNTVAQLAATLESRGVHLPPVTAMRALRDARLSTGMRRRWAWR